MDGAFEGGGRCWGRGNEGDIRWVRVLELWVFESTGKW